MADTFKISGGKFSTDESGRIKDIENFRDQELARMQGSPPIAASRIDPDMFDQDTGDYINFLDRVNLNRGLASIGGSYGGGEDQLAPANVAYIPDLNTYDDVGNIMNPAVPLGRNEAMQGLLDNMGPFEKGITNALASVFNYPRDEQGNITPAGLAQLRARTQQTKARDDELAEQRRKDQERAERAAMLAAQNQPVDPCPEGYRLDPVSRVCVPTDDMTTDPAPGTGRVYETLQEPVPNYTAASNIAVPTITLPDILTGN